MGSFLKTNLKKPWKLINKQCHKFTENFNLSTKGNFVSKIDK